MHVLVVLVHPEPKSLNVALKDMTVARMEALGHTVEVSDLYGQGFDPVERADHYTLRQDPNWFSSMIEQRYSSTHNALPEDVIAEIEKIERADLVVFHFPLWWHTHPAMLKGWFDRVFVNGALYTSKMRYDRGYFAGKKAVCAVTIGAPEAAFSGNGRGGDLISMMWPTHYSLYYMGFTVLPPFFAYGIQNSSGFTSMSDAELKQHLEDNKRAWGDYLVAHETHAPIVFPGWDDWDESGHQKAG